jgi:hypothetical protein
MNSLTVSTYEKCEETMNRMAIEGIFNAGQCV